MARASFDQANVWDMSHLFRQILTYLTVLSKYLRQSPVQYKITPIFPSKPERNACALGTSA
eukprot:6199293-Pleurochrysis_carterae.AAC.2